MINNDNNNINNNNPTNINNNSNNYTFPVRRLGVHLTNGGSTDEHVEGLTSDPSELGKSVLVCLHNK